MSDLHIAPGHKVYIDGVEIEHVLQVDVRSERASSFGSESTVVSIEFVPDSVVHGNPPAHTPADVYADKEGTARVDINKAITRAKNRLQGKATHAKTPPKAPRKSPDVYYPENNDDWVGPQQYINDDDPWADLNP